jgi:dethiobiotin synthetase
LLTLRAARTAGLDVRAVVLTPWPADPSELARTNRDAIASMGQIEVAELPEVEGPEPAALARAGALLPWRRWIAG